MSSTSDYIKQLDQPNSQLSLPPCFTSTANEVQQAREACVVFPVPNRTLIELTGPDRARFLNGFCTNDIAKLEVGHGLETFLTNLKGRTVGHIFVFAESESLWISTVPGQAETIIPHLDHYLITEEVELHDRSNSHLEWLFVGPTAFETVQQYRSDADLNAFTHLTHARIEIEGQPATLVRFDGFGAAGCLVRFSRQSAQQFAKRLAESDIAFGGSQAYETVRIDANFPAYGQDITTDNLPQEVDRTELAISFTKGCYLGQETVARLDALGHVNKLLTQFRVESGGDFAEPTLPLPIIDPESQKDVGKLTSLSTPLPDQPRHALGILRVTAREAGTRLQCKVSEDSTVDLIPILDPA